MADATFRELTARGRGAIAVVAVSGGDSVKIVDACFSAAAKKPLSKLSRRSIIYGRWNSTDEDLVVVIPENGTVEIHCHGGTAVVDVVTADLVAAGAKPLTENNATNSLASETEKALQLCRTQRTAACLLKLNEAWSAIDSGQHVSPNAAAAAIELQEFGRHLVQPWNVVLCGPPNAGKSSLINALSGFERAIVHATPGTTRDVIQQQTAIDGWPVVLSDTAGIRDAENEIEKEGVKLARNNIETADLVLFVFDITEDRQQIDAFLESTISLATNQRLILFNKLDLAGQGSVDPFDHTPSLAVSASTGNGLNELQGRISELLVPSLPDLSLPIPVGERQLRFLETHL